MKLVMEVKGIKKEIGRIEGVTKNILRELDEGLYLAVKTNTEPLAKQLCPKDKLNLEDSIYTQKIGLGVVAIGTPLFYGKCQELGFYISKEFAEHAAWGRGMPELEGIHMQHPFLIPAVEGTKDVIVQELQNLVNALSKR